MRPSIARHLQLSLIASLAIVWMIAAALVAWVVRHETEEVFNSTLQELAQRVLALAIIELNVAADAGATPVWTAPAPHDEYLTYQVFDRHERLLLRSHQAPAQHFPIPSHPGHHADGGRHYFVENSQDGRYFIKVAESLQHRQETYSDMLLYLLLPFGIALPISALVIYWAVRRAEVPIIDFGAQISRRDSRDLEPLDIQSLPIELAGVGESVNALMYRLHRALEAERSFTANSAHELRTPIAAALAQLDVLRDSMIDPAGQDRVVAARSMIAHLEGMTVKLLQLARAESGKTLHAVRLDLNRLAAMVLDGLSYRAQHRFDYTAPERPVWILGDIDAVGIALQNLLENADKYAASDSNVLVYVTADGRFMVQNDCPAIPSGVLAKLSQRFVRANQTQAGSGIGLSIVNTIAQQSDAAFSMRSPCFDNGRGFEVSIRFKADQAAHPAR